MAARIYRNRGAILWDFTTTFFAARRQFRDIYTRYEARVITEANNHGVDRMQLVLPPRELYKLFSLRRLESLRERRLWTMRQLAERIFGEEGDEGLLDAYCRHIYHEVAMLSQEHDSVGRFVSTHDPRRYKELFEEVRGYYPERLRRVKRFFELATRRLGELLPIWSEQRVMVRCAYLFGDRWGRLGYGRGRDALLQKMWPKRGGAIRGYLEAGRSFARSGFETQAEGALRESLRVAIRLQKRRVLSEHEVEARDASEALLQEITGDAAPRAAAQR